MNSFSKELPSWLKMLHADLIIPANVSKYYLQIHYRILIKIKLIGKYFLLSCITIDTD